MRFDALSRVHPRHCLALPSVVPGLRIGLLGGSFDPPHAGHAHITRWAFKKLELDQVWWLVSVKNPLKARQPATVARRVHAAQRLNKDPRVFVSRLEEQIGSSHTAETLGYLRRRFPAVRFVWLMGSDNLEGFSQWRQWRKIFHSSPISVFSRPAHRVSVLRSRAARSFQGRRVLEVQACRLADLEPPAWAFISIPLHSSASTSIRDRGEWEI